MFTIVLFCVAVVGRAAQPGLFECLDLGYRTAAYCHRVTAASEIFRPVHPFHHPTSYVSTQMTRIRYTYI